MRLTILQQDLLPALQSASRSIGIRASLPVLANILIHAEGSTLTFSATNLEIGVIKSIPAKIEEDGEVTVPGKTLLEIVSALPSSEITFESTPDQLKISSKSFNANLNGIAATEFPTIPLSSGEGTKINAKTLQLALPQIAFAAAADEGRPVLTGILTQIKKNTLELVATDGFRLARKTIPVGESNPLYSLIPRRTFEEVIRLISEEKDVETLELSSSENQNQMVFSIGQTKASSRLIEGQFPAWEKIIPTTFEATAAIDKAELLKAVKLASVFARDNANIVKLQVKPGQLILTSEAKELGGQETDLEAKTDGSQLTIAFNAKFLIESLTACPGEAVLVQFSGSLSPTLIKPTQEQGLEYVVMPVRLS